MDLSEDFRCLGSPAFLIVDVRAPSEFARGATANAVNLPILDDEERAAVGTAYRHEGAEAAQALGHRLVSGERRQARIRGWIEAVRAAERAGRTPMLCCWRGGDRSRIAQQWLAEAGIEAGRVSGGFKALRTAAIESIARAPVRPGGWLVLGGRTGCGKTDLLVQIDPSLDLEGLANHRGSAFGSLPGGQPTQVRFEFDLADALEVLADSVRPCVVEHESYRIGQVGVTEPMYEVLSKAPLVVLEATLDERIANVHRDYVAGPLDAGVSPDALAANLVAATERIRKKLGGDHASETVEEIGTAFESGSFDDHAAWIRRLLVRYYDPLYDRSLERQGERVVFRGERASVREFVMSEHAASLARDSGAKGPTCC